MPEAMRAELAGRIGGAFRTVFVLLAAFAAIGAVLAWTIPSSDWESSPRGRKEYPRA